MHRIDNTEESCTAASGCNGIIVRKIEKIEVENNGVVGQGHLSHFRYPQSFYCKICGVLYTPTPSNKLRFALREEIAKMNFTEGKKRPS